MELASLITTVIQQMILISQLPNSTHLPHPTRLKIPPFLKSFTLRAVMSENLPRPIAPADDRPTSRIWHSIIAPARGAAWFKENEGTSMRPRYDGAYVATRLAFRKDGRIAGQ